MAKKPAPRDRKARVGNQPGSALSAAEKTKKPAYKKPASTAFQRLTELVKWVDLVIEVLDGRLPVSTKHPKSEEIFGSRPRLIIYSKSDLADATRLKRYVKRLNEEYASPEWRGAPVKAVVLCLKGRENKTTFVEAALSLTKPKRDTLERRGLLPRPMRACVVGIPNVGKSSLINWFIGKKHAKVGDSPGVTKGTQWIRVHPDLEMLDTPGILPPNLFGEETMAKLSVLNLVPGDTYDPLTAAQVGIKLLKRHYVARLEEYVSGLPESENALEHIAKRKGFLAKGAKPDERRAANTFLHDIRDGKLGDLTLDDIG